MVHEVVMGPAAGVGVVDGVVVVVDVVVVDVGVEVVLLVGVRVVEEVDVLPVVGVGPDVVVVLVVVVLVGGVVGAVGAAVGAAPAVEIEHETPFRDADGSMLVPEGSAASLGVHEPAERFSTRAR
jgi:hypothetical protein